MSIKRILLLMRAEFNLSVLEISQLTGLSKDSIYDYLGGREPGEVSEEKIKIAYQRLRKEKARGLAVAYKINPPLLPKAS